MSEGTPIVRYNDLAKPGPGSPRVVRDPCPACGRYRAAWLSWAEAYDRYGTSRAMCMTCLLTDIPESATIP